MTLQDEIGFELQGFLQIKITYNDHFKQYLINDKFLQEIDADYWEKQLQSFKIKIFEYILLSKDHLSELEYWKIYIEKQMEEHFTFMLDSVEQVEFHRKKFLKCASDDFTVPLEEITFEQIQEASSLQDLRMDYDLVNFIVSRKLVSTVDSDEALQDLKLIFTLSQHKAVTRDLLYFIVNLIAEDKHLDLKAYSMKQREKLVLPKESVAINGIKCPTSMSKIEIARFFITLRHTDLFYFDKHDEKNDRILFQNFIQDNFSYVGDQNKQTEINNITRQFSDALEPREFQKQIEFVNTIIDKMTKYRDAIK